SIERDDHLVGTDQAKVLAHQLVGHVRVGPFRVEQVGTMLELRMLTLDLRKLGLPLLERMVIAAPGEDPVRPGDGVAGERPHDDHSEGRHRHPADQPQDTVRPSYHDVKGIMSESRTQAKRMVWWTKRG